LHKQGKKTNLLFSHYLMVIKSKL